MRGSDPKKVGGYLYNPMFRGYLHERWNGEPLNVIEDEMEVHEVLDIITDAVERGALGRESWPEQLFASEEDLLQFCQGLEESYDDIFRIVDRWWFALSELLNRPDEEEFITGSHVARVFEDEYATLRARRAEAAAAAKKATSKAKKPAKAKAA